MGRPAPRAAAGRRGEQLVVVTRALFAVVTLATLAVVTLACAAAPFVPMLRRTAAASAAASSPSWSQSHAIGTVTWSSSSPQSQRRASVRCVHQRTR